MLKVGDKVLCVSARDCYELTLHKEYVVIRDEEEGIFASRPYVTVMGNTKEVSCHASRFKLVNEVNYE